MSVVAGERDVEDEDEAGLGGWISRRRDCRERERRKEPGCLPEEVGPRRCAESYSARARGEGLKVTVH